jgi:hypothetical protein
VHEHVEPAELLVRFVDGGTRTLGIAHVGDDAAAGLANVGRIGVDRDDARADRREAFDQRATDAAGAGDDDGRAGEPEPFTARGVRRYGVNDGSRPGGSGVRQTRRLNASRS